MAKQELLATIRDRYQASSRKEKSRILDAFIAVTGHHRKHGIGLLGQSGDDGEQQPAVKKGRRIYDESVRQSLSVVWEAADWICGKRLKAALPHLVESMECHGHLYLDARGRKQLLSASAATLDRLLQPIRTPGRPPAQTQEESVAGPQYTGADLRRLEYAAGIPGDRPNGPSRGLLVGFHDPQPGGHRYLHRVKDGSIQFEAVTSVLVIRLQTPLAAHRSV